MTDAYARYRSPEPPVPSETWAWNLYGAGIESIGRGGRPERFPVPQPGPDQLLVRVDAVGMCFSDVKLIKQGGKHPKLYDRDLARDPTRLGHEVALTVEGAHERGKWVGVCGGLASDPLAVPLLAGLGVDELSVNVPAVASVKARIRSLSFEQARQLAERALRCSTATEVREKAILP